MSTTSLCPDCGDIREFSLLQREETYDYRGESITLVHELSVCTNCSAEVSTAHQVTKSLDAVREEYQRRHIAR